MNEHRSLEVDALAYQLLDASAAYAVGGCTAVCVSVCLSLSVTLVLNFEMVKHAVFVISVNLVTSLSSSLMVNVLIKADIGIDTLKFGNGYKYRWVTCRWVLENVPFWPFHYCV